jgi:2-dehydropantoate 2-reductase
VEQAGLDVVMCARPPVASVVLERGGREHRLAAAVTYDPDRVQPAGWVLLATKAPQTGQAGPWLARLCRPGTVVVVLRNGVDHAERVRSLAPGATVVPALVYVAAERVAPGRVVHVAANPITALTGRRRGVLRDREVRELARELLAEAVAVGIAEGARLSAEDVARTLGSTTGSRTRTGRRCSTIGWLADRSSTSSSAAR